MITCGTGGDWESVYKMLTDGQLSRMDVITAHPSWQEPADAINKAQGGGETYRSALDAAGDMAAAIKLITSHSLRHYDYLAVPEYKLSMDKFLNGRMQWLKKQMENDSSDTATYYTQQRQPLWQTFDVDNDKPDTTKLCSTYTPAVDTINSRQRHRIGARANHNLKPVIEDDLSQLTNSASDSSSFANSASDASQQSTSATQSSQRSDLEADASQTSANASDMDATGSAINRNSSVQSAHSQYMDISGISQQPIRDTDPRIEELVRNLHDGTVQTCPSDNDDDDMTDEIDATNRNSDIYPDIEAMEDIDYYRMHSVGLEEAYKKYQLEPMSFFNRNVASPDLMLRRSKICTEFQVWKMWGKDIDGETDTRKASDLMGAFPHWPAVVNGDGQTYLCIPLEDCKPIVLHSVMIYLQAGEMPLYWPSFLPYQAVKTCLKRYPNAFKRYVQLRF